MGKSDEESLQIIVAEVQRMEKVFAEKLNYQPTSFTLPENKAKQVKFLSIRIEELQGLL